MQNEVKAQDTPVVSQFISGLIDSIAEDQFANQKLHFDNFENFHKKVSHNTLKNYEEYGNMLDDGFNLLLNSSYFSEEEKLQIGEKISAIQFSEFDPGGKFDEAGTLGAFIGFDDTFYQKGWERGKQLLEEEKTDEALNVFMILTHLDPSIYQFSLGMGLALMAKDKPQEALQAFSFALTYARDDSYAICINMTSALVAMGENEKALELLRIVLRETKGKEEFKSIFKNARDRLKIIKGKPLVKKKKKKKPSI